MDEDANHVNLTGIGCNYEDQEAKEELNVTLSIDKLILLMKSVKGGSSRFVMRKDLPSFCVWQHKDTMG